MVESLVFPSFSSMIKSRSIVPDHFTCDSGTEASNTSRRSFMRCLGSLCSGWPSPLLPACRDQSVLPRCFPFPVDIHSSSSARWETRPRTTLLWTIMPSIPRMTRSGVASSKLFSLFWDAEGFRGIPRLGLQLSHSCGSGGVYVRGCWLFALLLEVALCFFIFLFDPKMSSLPLQIQKK